MKRRTEISNKEKYITTKKIDLNKNRSDFYERWYAKFGKPETRTMPADKFLERMKEMIEFE